MDEFSAYHTLGCAAFPLSRQFNVYREGCEEYELRPPFFPRPLPLRSYLYIGSFPVVPFYPFWRLLREPVAARIQGAVFFLVTLHLATALLRVRFERVLLASLLFPVFLGSFLVDTGPVGISLVLLFSSLVLLRGAVGAERWTLAALAGLAVFLGLWVKLVFAWCLPAVLCYLVYLLRRQRRTPVILAFAVAFLVPTLLLLFAQTADKTPYYRVVERGGVSLDPEDVVTSARSLGTYFWNASLVVPRVLSWPVSPIDVLPLGVGIFLLLSPAARRARVAALLVGGALTFGVADLSTRAVEAHHVVFALGFVVLALASALDRPLWPFSLLVLAYWTSLALRSGQVTIDPRSNFAKDRLLASIRDAGLDRRTVQLHTSWGTYYIAHLFGDESQIVLFSKKFPDEGDLLARARAVADSQGRGILMITRKPERLASEAVDAALGKPLGRQVFDNWSAVEYLR
jgi:hypothetical protein